MPNEKELALIEKRAAPLIMRATTINITTQAEQNAAGELLTQLNREADAFKVLKETITKPMNLALKAARDLFKPRETKLDDAITTLRAAIGFYQLEADKKAALQDKKIADRVAPGRGNLSAETASRKMTEVDRPDQHIETIGGSVKFRTVQKLVVTDDISLKTWLLKNCPHLLSFEERSILGILKSGMPVLGAHMEDEKQVVNNR